MELNSNPYPMHAKSAHPSTDTTDNHIEYFTEANRLQWLSLIKILFHIQIRLHMCIFREFVSWGFSWYIVNIIWPLPIKWPVTIFSLPQNKIRHPIHDLLVRFILLQQTGGSKSLSQVHLQTERHKSRRGCKTVRNILSISDGMLTYDILVTHYGRLMFQLYCIRKGMFHGILWMYVW